MGRDGTLAAVREGPCQGARELKSLSPPIGTCSSSACGCIVGASAMLFLLLCHSCAYADGASDPSRTQKAGDSQPGNRPRSVRAVAVFK